MLLRVQKIIAEAGIASRRGGEKLILEGKVKVNGKTCKLGDKADPNQDEITVLGKPLPRQEKKVYLILNKPTGYVTTVSEPFGMKKVTDLFKDKIKERVYPIGRLDKDSEGLLLLTNDGELAQKLTHPSFGVSKTYLVKLDKPAKEDDLEKLGEGLEIEGRRIILEKLAMLGPKVIEVKIHEGRKHILRNLFGLLGYKVTKLRRINFGPLELRDDLRPGKWRPLTEKEVQLLKKAAVQREDVKP